MVGLKIIETKTPYKFPANTGCFNFYIHLSIINDKIDNRKCKFDVKHSTFLTFLKEKTRSKVIRS